MFFLSRRYRPNKWPFYGLLALEVPVTVGLLALFGIAAPDLYRTRLWLDGAENGFNSNPNAALYAAANYRPYTVPMVWSQFITNYNVVIAVLSMFIMLAKAIMYMLHVFPPIINALVHLGLIAVYIVSAVFQAGSDMSDPNHPQPGPPWYITKPCSVAVDQANVGYCEQAKAAFACTVSATGIFAAFFVMAVYSCFPSKAHQAEYAEKRRLRDERYGDKSSNSNTSNSPADDEELKSPPLTAFTVNSMTPMNPMTPRTLAFNRLGGTTHISTSGPSTRPLPLRRHFSSPHAPKSPTAVSFATARLDNQALTLDTLQSPDFPRSPLGPAVTRAGNDPGPSTAATGGEPSGMYFPPPPKVAIKK